MPQRVPLMFVPPKLTRKLSRLFTYVSNKLSRFIPGMKYDLEATDIGLDAEEYISSAIVNGLVFFLLFSALLTFLYQTQGKTFSAALGQGAAYAALIFAVIFFTLIRYPKIMAGKKAELVDKHLIFALKDLLLQISSGVTLFNGMVNVSKAGYGQASIELDKVVRNVNSGMPVDKALEKMALESKSEFLRKTTWQLINTLKAGASLKGTLRTLIDDLALDQRDKIKSYTHELNMWTLVYMLFAVAVPSIGATLMIILSSFAGFGITQAFFIVFITLCFIAQIILIGFVKTRRPAINV